MKKKILIIEDENALCFLMKGILESTGRYEVMVANDGKSGYDRCVQANPDLIFLDYIMPNENGDHTVRSLKKDERTKNIPIVLMSGMGEAVYFHREEKNPLLIHYIVEDSDRSVALEQGYHFMTGAKALETGVVVYLPKPFSKEALLEVTGKILAGFKKGAKC
jgi:CheY-like chemotaxis protein